MLNQKKWITFKELVCKGYTALEILDLIKKGDLQAYYSTWGERIIDSDPLEKTRRISFEITMAAKKLVADAIKMQKPSWKSAPRSEIQIEKEAKEEYEAQPLDEPITPENCIAISFSQPSEKEKEIINNAVFKAKDIDEFEKQQALKEPKESEKNVFPCEPGTNWEDIHITLVADNMVRIKTPKGEGRYMYPKLGMQDGRGGDKPTMIWALLKIFAENQGFISSQNPHYDSKLPDTAKRLNADLKKLFGINESIYQGHYKKEKGYRTKIKFSDQTIVVD